jgi:uncharacterized membrane protein YeaQ/YmgE (transglycosylase-associated protein family)
MVPNLAFSLYQGHFVVIGWGGGLISWIFIGLLAGWIAGKLSRGAGYGCLMDIILGLVGSILGGWIFTKLGILGTGGFLYSFATAIVGAVILVAIAHLFSGGRRT